MKLGLSSYTFTWAVGVKGMPTGNTLTVYDLIDRTAAHELEILQIADNITPGKLSDYDLEEIRRYAHKKGIMLELGGRGLTPGHTMQCLAAAERLNSGILRMVIDDAGFEPDIYSVISIIRELVPELKSRNIKLAIENHDRFKAREFEMIIQSVGSEMAGICLDSVNSMGAGEGFETVSEILIPYTINLHIKDFSITRVPSKMGFIIEGRPAGKGMLNIHELLGKISATGLCQSAIIELWTPPEKSIEETVIKEEKWAEESIQYLKSLF